MLHLVLWKWSQPNARETYTSEHVNVMTAMLHRNMGGLKYRIICVTDEARGVECETFPLWDDCDNLANASKWDLPSCYRRLKLYDPATQNAMGIKPGELIVSIDLDALILKPLAPLIAAAKTYAFMGWALKGQYHPKVFNGSLQIFKAGTLSEIWSTFNAATSPKEANRAKFMGSDQSWLSMNLVHRPDCEGFGYPDVASYPHNIRQLAMLSRDVRIIFFHGRRKPWHREALKESPWINRYWR